VQSSSAVLSDKVPNEITNLYWADAGACQWWSLERDTVAVVNKMLRRRVSQSLQTRHWVISESLESIKNTVNKSCGRLSWLPVSFLLHVKYTLSYRIVPYRGRNTLLCCFYPLSRVQRSSLESHELRVHDETASSDDLTFICLNMVPACDRRTDGRTDRQTEERTGDNAAHS